MKEYAIKGKSDRKSALLIILNMVWGGQIVHCLG